MNVILCLVGIISIIEAVILDPALYLAPSPPLTTSRDNDAKKMWAKSMDSQINIDSSATFLEKKFEDITTDKSESLEVSETFWPSYRSSSLKSIYVPLSFHLSGTYGGSSSGSGVYSSGYMGMPTSYDTLGKVVLAGTNYKSLGGHSGLRIFGSNKRPSWSGWGNGKWGHYGKG